MRCQGDATDFSCRCDYWGAEYTHYPDEPPPPGNQRLIPRPGGVFVTGECDPEEDEWHFTLHYETDAGSQEEDQVDFDAITCYPEP